MSSTFGQAEIGIGGITFDVAQAQIRFDFFGGVAHDRVVRRHQSIRGAQCQKPRIHLGISKEFLPATIYLSIVEDERQNGIGCILPPVAGQVAVCT